MVKSLWKWGRLGSLGMILTLLLATSFYPVPSPPNHQILFKVAPVNPDNSNTNSVYDIATDIPAFKAAEVVTSSKSSPPPQIGDEYLALGDSVAYGVGAPSPNEQGYAGQFYSNYLRRVQPHLSNYKNLGVPGETSTSFIETGRGRSQLQRTLDELDTAKAAKRRISPITLTIGGNDMLDARNQTQTGKDAALSKYDANLQHILDSLKSHINAETDVIVTTYFNPYGGPSSQENDIVWIQRFNALIQQRAQEHGFKSADFYTPILGNEASLTWASYGDVHPNNQGYAKLARQVWQTTSYDSVPPTLNLLYSNLPQAGKVQMGQRFAFKIEIQDNWAIGTGLVAGAGTIWDASINLDDNPQQNLPSIPNRFNNGPAGSQQYSYILDTNNLKLGPHILHLAATDAAGNSQKLDVNFEIVN